MPKCRTCAVEAETQLCPECDAIMVVTCPKCKVGAKLKEGFACEACGRAGLCLGHIDREAGTCAECHIATDPSPPLGFRLLKRNEEGFREYLCEKDRSRMALVSAGEFLYGENKQRLYLPSFLIDVWPVTNGQYAKFCKATGHPAPDDWDEPILSKPKQPVVGVSWHDAVAYCEWVGKRLPTDEEWEKAARGHDGRKFPWGNEPPDDTRANFGKRIGRTSSVGRFPDGRSPFGCADMAGNVLEWCGSWHLFERRTRVLRGGAWVSEPNTLRTSLRFGDAPTCTYPIFGFRCALDWGKHRARPLAESSEVEAS